MLQDMEPLVTIVDDVFSLFVRLGFVPFKEFEISTNFCERLYFTLAALRFDGFQSRTVRFKTCALMAL